MSGSRAFLRKEVHEIRKTWRIWVLPGMIVFFAVASPIVAVVTPALVSSLAGSQPGVVIQLPEPVARDAYLQFLRNLVQIVLIAVIITGASAVSGEKRNGTAVLVLTKPVSRAGFIWAKVSSQALLLVTATTVGAVVCVLGTSLLFESELVGRFVSAVGLWLVLALLMVSVTTWLSVLFRSATAAAGVGLGVYFLLALLAVWPPAGRYTFAGLSGGGYRLVSGQPFGWGWPVATGLGAAVLFAGLAVWSFRRQEI